MLFVIRQPLGQFYDSYFSKIAQNLTGYAGTDPENITRGTVCSCNRQTTHMKFVSCSFHAVWAWNTHGEE